MVMNTLAKVTVTKNTDGGAIISVDGKPAECVTDAGMRWDRSLRQFVFFYTIDDPMSTGPITHQLNNFTLNVE